MLLGALPLIACDDRSEGRCNYLFYRRTPLLFGRQPGPALLMWFFILSELPGEMSIGTLATPVIALSRQSSLVNAHRFRSRGCC
jgi:hypothetical protein